ncbi:hypothetical protein [Chitinophaga sancti]|uniref:Outer membrane protein beta-barrel domain-containing protein n=1 Tax=Chitinophaga sancti TaxID=1004 RepID=A0A1K1RQ90_9BACT|nr:hypothetical protein [Chitinophaga sancti]WQD62564.1 hypothetical protein U0033_32230 [Chitinophaga sancti]WQG91867.1 hypothetical protein SR876_10155 [Chitinophaga sancti]SFW73879.1 hypothetical protein SAMN05661012_04067 [Chitinophaga sancti]
MKKSLLIALLCLSAFFTSQAQHFTNGLGIALIHDETKYSKDNPYIALAYTPGFTFKENSKYSFSINAPVRIGYAQYYYTQTYGSVTVSDDWKSYLFQVPLMFNFNYGAGSSQKARGRIGFFGGAGIAAQYRTYDEVYIDTYNSVHIIKNSSEFSTNVAINAGIRFAIGRSYRRRNLELGTALLVGVTGETHDLFNYHVLFNF